MSLWEAQVAGVKVPIGWYTKVENALGLGYPAVPASYIIHQVGSDFIARNGHDGTILDSGTDFATLAQAVQDALTKGGLIYIKGNGDNIDVTKAIEYDEATSWVGDAASDDTANTYGTSLQRSTDNPIFTPKTTGGAHTIRHALFRNMDLLGAGKGTGSSGLIKMDSNTSSVKCEHMTFRTSGGDGVDMDGTSFGLSMIGCRAQSLTGDLVSKVTPDTGTTVNLLGCISTYGGYVADLYGVSGVTILNCGGDNFDAGAVKMSTCLGALIAGCDFEGDSVTGTPADMIELIGSRVTCQANRILYGGTGAGEAPIKISGGCSNAGIIQGNMVQNTIGTYSIILASDCVDWKIFDNYFDKTQSGWATGRAVFRGNSTFISEKSGTDTIANGTTSKVVAHGLSFTPTEPMFVITLLENPTNTPGAIWIDTIGAANFTVNCENDPGASNLDFAWSVKMDRVEP